MVLSIPPPHNTIKEFKNDVLCMARVWNSGRGGQCSRMRQGQSQFCAQHLRMVRDRKQGLPYGRVDHSSEKHIPKAELNPGLATDHKGAATLDKLVMEHKRKIDAQKVDDKVLLRRVQNLVVSMQRSDVTLHSVQTQLEATFGMDLSSRRQWLQRHIEALLAFPTSSMSIMSAAFGHPTDASRARDVTEKLCERLRHQGGVRLDIGVDVPLLKWLQDPCPEISPKILSMRYQICGQRGEIKARVRPGTINESELFLKKPISLAVPKTYKHLAISIIKATFGHPHDPTKLFDVTESVQGRLDLARGKLLEILSTEPVRPAFGDPCFGVNKARRHTHSFAMPSPYELLCGRLTFVDAARTFVAGPFHST